MAESITAAITTVPSNVVSGQPATFVITVSNTGDADATIRACAPVVNPSAYPYRCQPFSAPPGSSQTVAATSGTLKIPMQMIFFAPNGGNGANNSAQAAGHFDITFAVNSSAGSNVVTPMKTVAVSPGNQASPPASGGQLDFSQPGNSGLAL